MRKTANKIIRAILQAVDPFQSVCTHLTLKNNKLLCGSQQYNLNNYKRIRVIGFGKGSAPMAHAIYSLLSHKISDGFIIVKYNHTLPTSVNINPIKIVEAGHPIPDANSIKHTHTLLALLADSHKHDLIISLISGGGSALLTQLRPGLSLTHIQSLTQTLLKAGATITEINTIRKHLSKVKGGQLAALAQPATIISLILSDVINDKLDIIASGPTTSDSSTFSDALLILEKYKLKTKIQPSILNYLQNGVAGKNPETPKADNLIFKQVQNVIIANNKMALMAATQKAQSLGLHAAYFAPFIQGEAKIVAQEIGSLARKLSQNSDLFQKPLALIFGGETTVTITGNGLGGRNQELALAIALEIKNQSNLLVVCLATDGNDGPTNAAGAIVDGNTVNKALKLGLNPQHYLKNNNSYHLFKKINSLIITGPTNTNVNDVILVFTW